MIKWIFLSVIIFFSGIVSGQNQVIVPNGDFGFVTKKVKEDGQIQLASPWVSPTLIQADLYVTKTKSGYVGVPRNAYGEEKAMEGENYAGILAYSYKNKEPRSYLQVKLNQKLEKGKRYCVTFNVSLADLSKYAIDKLGAYLSKNAVGAKNEMPLIFEPQIISKKAKIYEKQFYWTPICGTYLAQGDEEHITIGNFFEEEKLVTKKVKRPRGFTSPQTYDAYYYIDNITIEEVVGDNIACDCDKVQGMEHAETVVRNYSSDKQIAATQIIGSAPTDVVTNGDGTIDATKLDLTEQTLLFSKGSAVLEGNAKKQVNQLVAFLKGNPNAKVKLIGHYDKQEKPALKLDVKRVAAVYKTIVTSGIAKERVLRDKKGATVPVNSKEPGENSRVHVHIKK